MASNYETFKNKLNDTKSHAFRQLKYFVTKPIRNMSLDSLVAHELTSQSIAVDRITYNDVFSNLKVFRPKEIFVDIQVYIRPGDKYRINKDVFKNILLNDSDISKDAMLKFIRNDLLKQKFYKQHEASIKQKFIRQILRGYKSVEKVDMAYAYLIEYLKIRIKFLVDDEEVKEFIDEQYKFMNNELKKVKTNGDKITVNSIIEDTQLRKILGKSSKFENVFTASKLMDTIQFAYVLVKPTPLNIARFIVLNKHFNVSKRIIQFISKQANRHSEYGNIDITNWDNNRLSASINRVIEENPEESKQYIIEDTEFSKEFLLSNYSSDFKELTTTDKGHHILVKN